MQVTFDGAEEVGAIMQSGNAPQDWFIIPAENGYLYVKYIHLPVRPTNSFNTAFQWTQAGPLYGISLEDKQLIMLMYAGLDPR